MIALDKSIEINILNVMTRLKKYFSRLLTGAIVLSLSSCASALTQANTDTPVTQTIQTFSVTQLDATGSTPAQDQQVAPVVTQPLKATNTKAISTTPSNKTVSLNIYQADSQCQALVSEKVAIPLANSVNAAVGNVLKQADSGDFDLVGYRVNVNANSRMATVDLRLSPDSRRQFVSLSTCEQFALFGSLRKTLTSNSQLKIKAVRFTQQGKEIKL